MKNKVKYNPDNRLLIFPIWIYAAIIKYFCRLKLINLRLLLNKTVLIIVLLACLFCLAQKATAQCATPINIFPYTEGFETTNGNWTTGGNASDWAWGMPSKTVITGAASASTNCWIVGGLTGNAYNNGERSWLQSPCFDFTTVQHPYISFSVFGRWNNVSMEPVFNTQPTRGQHGQMLVLFLTRQIA